MKTYAVALLPEPHKVRIPGQRSQELAYAVTENGVLHSLWKDEYAAMAYCMRCNQLRKER